MLANLTAFLRMELASIEIVLVHRSRVGQYVVGRRYGFLTHGNVVGMDEIDIFALKALHQRRLGVVKPVPSHARHFVLMPRRQETLHLCVENANAVGIALLGVATK